MLLDRQALDRVVEILKPEHFFSEGNSRVFEAALSLAEAGTPVDVVSVAGYLRDRQVLASIGGAPYLAQITDATPAVAHVVAHARIVFEKWRLRAIIALCQRVAAEGYGDVGDTTDFVDGAARELAELQQVTSVADGVMIGDVVDRVTARILSAGNAAAEGGSAPLRTGFAMLDQFIGSLRAPDVTLLGAPPGCGKSSFAREICANISAQPLYVGNELVKQGSAIFSLEMSDDEIAYAMACTYGRVDSLKIDRGDATPDDYARLWSALAWVRSLPIAIYGRRDMRVGSLPMLVEDAKEKLRAKGAVLRLLVVDHLGLLVANETYDPKDEEKVYKNVSRKIGDLAVAKNLHVLLLSQLTKKDDGWYARGSRDVEANAQAFWLLKVDEKKTASNSTASGTEAPFEARITIKKQRKGPKNVNAFMWFTPAFTHFSDSIYEGGSYE
jgi:replicative DNA helicase